MKAILRYKNYYSFGKHYQFEFTYDDEFEAEKLTTFIKNFKENQDKEKQIQPFYSKLSTRSTNNRTINVIEKTNIPKEILLPFTSMLISMNNCKIIIGKEEFSTFDITTIQEAINKLHLNATLNKGNFLALGDTYYLTFRYACDEQKDELSYYFNCKLNYTDTNDIYRVMVDQFGNFTNESNGTIIAINVPKVKLQYFVKTFIEDYNMIITIGSKSLKEEFKFEELQKALSILDIEKTGRSRKRTMQGTREQI